MTNGARTRDIQDHNLALYQLSYGHRSSRGLSVRQWTFRRVVYCFTGPSCQQIHGFDVVDLVNLS